MKLLPLLFLFACNIKPVEKTEETETPELESYSISLKCRTENDTKALEVEYYYEENYFGTVLHDDIKCVALENNEITSSDSDEFGICDFEAYDQYHITVRYENGEMLVKQLNQSLNETSFFMYCEEN